MNLRTGPAARAVRFVVVAMSVYVIMLTIGFMSWRRPDALMALIRMRAFLVLSALEKNPALLGKKPPSPSPVSPSPKPSASRQ
jgi:hypothetical protein